MSKKSSERQQQPWSPCHSPSDDLPAKRIRWKHSKLNFRIKETKKISVFEKWQNRLYKVGFGWNFFKSEIIKGNSPSFNFHCAFRASKSDCERVQVEEGEDTVFRAVSRSATRPGSCTTCWAVRDPSSGLRQCKIITGATRPGLCATRSTACYQNFKQIPLFHFKFAQLVEVGS